MIERTWYISIHRLTFFCALARQQNRTEQTSGGSLSQHSRGPCPPCPSPSELLPPSTPFYCDRPGPAARYRNYDCNLPTDPPTYRPADLPAYPTSCLSTCLLACLSACLLAACLPACLPACLTTCLATYPLQASNAGAMPSGEMLRERRGKVEYAQVSTGFLLFAQHFSQPDCLPVGWGPMVMFAIWYPISTFFLPTSCSREYELHVHTIHNLPLWLGIVVFGRRPLHTQKQLPFFPDRYCCPLHYLPSSILQSRGKRLVESDQHVAHTYIHTYTYTHTLTHTYIHTYRGMMMMMMMI